MRTRTVFASLALMSTLLLTGCTEFGQAPVISETTYPSGTTLDQTNGGRGASETASAASSVAPVKTSAPVKTVAPAPTKKAPASTVSARKAKALAQLKTIKVQEADYGVDYNRTKDFGPAWEDMDHNGCDTRNDMLRKALVNIVYRSNDPGCTIASGVLASDPYTAKKISFVRGVQTSTVLNVDHLVPLAYAARHGAEQWSFEERENYANDQKTVLLVVDGPANVQKSDSGPADWMPANTAYRCTYVEKFTNILATYKLTVSRRDFAKINSVLATCK